jgi:hypothetical protein
MNEMRIARAASRVAETLPTRELEQLSEAWSAHDRLAEHSLRIGTMSLERSLTERTVVLSDRVMANYRTPSPTVRENQWRMAREALARAVALSPGDRQLRAAFRKRERPDGKPPRRRTT